MPEWMDKLVQQPLYMMERLVGQVTWGMDRSGLYIIDMLDRFRQQLVTQGFTNALDVVATEVIGVSRPVFELALTTFMLLVIATPIVSFKWVNLKKVLVFAVLIPILLPVLAGGFQDIDAARGDLGSMFYNRIFNRSTFNLVPDDEPQGTERAILLDANGRIPPYSVREDGLEGMRGVDVAASYLWATRGDVVNPPGSLPTAFEERYFPYDVGRFGQYDTASRWILIEQGGNGITRTIYGLILVAFAFLETLVNLGFTLALGFLLIAFLISLIFVWFTPFEGMTITIIKKIVDLFLQSWGISAVQGLTLAAVISAANSGGAVAVLGVGVMGLALEVLFVSVAYKAVITAVTGMGTGSSLNTFEAAKAFAPIRSAAGAAAGAATTMAGGMAGAAMMVPAAALAYRAARQSGASPAFARGYMAQTDGPLAAIGSMATAMGYGGSDFVAGAAQGQQANNRDYGLSSPMARHSIATHVDRQAQQTERAADRQVREERYQVSQGERAQVQQQREADRAERAQAAQARAAQIAREAPIRAINRATIADQMTNAYASAHVSDPTRPATVDSVTTGLGLASGSFGRNTPAVQTVLNDLHQTPLAPDLTQRLMIEAAQEGVFRPETRIEAQQDLVASGMGEKDATSRLTTMQGHMQKLPTSVRVEDALSAEAVQQRGRSAYAGYSAAHRVQPAEPIVTPYNQPTFQPPPPPPNYDRGLPAPVEPPTRPPSMGRQRPRYGARQRGPLPSRLVEKG